MKTLLKLPELNLHEQSENLAPRAKSAIKPLKSAKWAKFFAERRQKGRPNTAFGGNRCAENEDFTKSLQFVVHNFALYNFLTKKIIPPPYVLVNNIMQ